MANPNNRIILRPHPIMRLGATLGWIAAAIYAINSMHNGELGPKILILNLALAFSLIGIYLAWFGGYIIDDDGISRKLKPIFFYKRLTPIIYWHKDIIVNIKDHGIAGNMLEMRNIDSDSKVMITKYYVPMSEFVAFLQRKSTRLSDTDRAKIESMVWK